MYSNMDSALQFLEKYSGMFMKDLRFTQTQTDPFIFFKHNKMGRLSIIISMHIKKMADGGIYRTLR